jgi:hypothetical protein
MNFKSLNSDDPRAALVAIALEWEQRYGVAPAGTSAMSPSMMQEGRALHPPTAPSI